MGVDGEQEDAFLLGEDRLVGEVRLGRCRPHRPTIRRPHRSVVGRWIEGDAMLDDPVAGRLELGGPPSVHGGAIACRRAICLA